MNVVGLQLKLDDGTTREVFPAQATGIVSNNCGFTLDDGRRLYLRMHCSPVHLFPMRTYWVALEQPESADESHACCQVNRPDSLRAEIALISNSVVLGITHAYPSEMFPPQHTC